VAATPALRRRTPRRYVMSRGTAVVDRSISPKSGMNMISFALAQEMKKAGLTPPPRGEGRYFVNEHLMIRREDAVRMWYADKAKKDWEFKLEEELVYCPTMSELVDGCGAPFVLSAERADRWTARQTVLDETAVGEGPTAVEAVARLWLVLRTRI
jgi:hypothetical protein